MSWYASESNMTEREVRHEIRNRLAIIRLAETILKSESRTDEQEKRARKMLLDARADLEQMRPLLSDEDRAYLDA